MKKVVVVRGNVTQHGLHETMLESALQREGIVKVEAVTAVADGDLLTVIIVGDSEK